MTIALAVTGLWLGVIFAAMGAAVLVIDLILKLGFGRYVTGLFSAGWLLLAAGAIILIGLTVAFFWAMFMSGY